MPAWPARDDVTLVGENAQPKIDTIQSIILPFTTARQRFVGRFERPSASFPNAAVDGQRCRKTPRDLAAIIAQARFGSALAGTLRKFHPCRCPAVGRRVSLQVASAVRIRAGRT